MEQYELAVFDPKIKTKWLEVADLASYEKETIFAIQSIRASEPLQKCDMQSLRNCVVNIAMIGITLNPLLQQCFLIPRKGKAILDLSYRGLCKVAVDSDSVYDIDATAVFEGDFFQFEMGLKPVLIHRPKMFDDEKGKKVIAVYAIATLHHNIKKFVVLDKEKIERARKSSQTDKVWIAHYDEMAKKTAVKLLYKLLPQTEKMSIAAAVLNEHEGLAPSQAKAEAVMKRFNPEGDPKAQGAEESFECPKTPGVFTFAVSCLTCEDREPVPGDICPAYLVQIAGRT